MGTIQGHRQRDNGVPCPPLATHQVTTASEFSAATRKALILEYAAPDQLLRAAGVDTLTDDSLTGNLATPGMFSYTHTIHIHHNGQEHRVLPEILFPALFPHVRWSSPACATKVMSAMLATWARAQVMHTVRPKP